MYASIIQVIRFVAPGHEVAIATPRLDELLDTHCAANAAHCSFLTKICSIPLQESILSYTGIIAHPGYQKILFTPFLTSVCNIMSAPFFIRLLFHNINKNPSFATANRGVVLFHYTFKNLYLLLKTE
jgi:hypothetical protein